MKILSAESYFFTNPTLTITNLNALAPYPERESWNCYWV